MLGGAANCVCMCVSGVALVGIGIFIVWATWYNTATENYEEGLFFLSRENEVRLCLICLRCLCDELPRSLTVFGVCCLMFDV